MSGSAGEKRTGSFFTIRCNGHAAFLYVLFEHQSTNDPLMAFRLLRYLVRIWEAVLVEPNCCSGFWACGSARFPRPLAGRFSRRRPSASTAEQSGSSPRRVSKKSSANEYEAELFPYALMGQPLRRAMGVSDPPRWLERAIPAALRLRARCLRALPKRKRPKFATARNRPTYPDGYRVEQLGTFPEGRR
jgi:hypothetical protein